MAHADVVKKALGDSLKKCLENESIEKVTVEQLCEDSGVSHTSFYRYFSDKYEVLTWIIEHEFFREKFRDPEIHLMDVYEDFIRYIYESRGFFRNSLSFNGQNSLREYLYERWYPVLEKDFRGAFPSREWEEFFIRWYIRMSQECYLRWLEEKEMQPWEKFYREHVEMFRRFLKGAWRTLEMPGENRTDL